MKILWKSFAKIASLFFKPVTIFFYQSFFANRIKSVLNINFVLSVMGHIFVLNL